MKSGHQVCHFCLFHATWEQLLVRALYLHVRKLDALEVVHVDVAGVEVAHENILVDPSLDGPQPDGVEHASQEGLGVNSTHFISVIKIFMKES